MKYPNELVLYVDDEPANCVVFQQTFKQNFNIACVESGEAALAFLKQKKVAVIITDQRMPGMSGNELLATVRRAYPDVVRIVVTAFADSDPVLRAINEGLVARYVVKPWDVPELRQVIAWAVEAHVMGAGDSSLHARILETERLVTLGKISAATLHDMAQPLGYLQNNSTVLAGLSSSMNALTLLLKRHGHELHETDLANLEQLAESLPEITSDMLFGCTVLGQITQDVRRFVAKSEESVTSRSTEPAAILRYALATCRGIATSARAKLVYQDEALLPRVRIGPTELAQILINLLSNASQAVERGGGGTVTIATRSHADHLQITVEDDGPGIPAELLPRIGTLFLSGSKEGTGLGIAQVKRLLHASGGDLHIFSGQGNGTKVVVSIPVAKSHADN